MRLLEIGDGLKSIKVPDKYYSDWEGDSAVLFYDSNNEFAQIRISVVTADAENEEDSQAAFTQILQDAKEKGFEAKITDDKSYYHFSEESESDGEQINLSFFIIGFKSHIIIMSITVPTTYAQNNKGEVDAIFTEMESCIPSISELSLKTSTIFEPKYTDFMDIEERAAAMFEIDARALAEHHQEGKSLPQIQRSLDAELFTPQHTNELQSVGLALGDYIQTVYPDFHWAVTRDEYGRDWSLQYKTLSLSVFPMTMISKRVEDGESVNVQELVDNLVAQVIQMEASGKFGVLDHNG